MGHLKKITIILTDNNIKNGSGLNEEITLHPSSIPCHLLFCVFSDLFYPKYLTKSC